jgi:hypothetical protein
VPSFLLFIILSIVSIAANAQQESNEAEPLWIDQAMDDVIAPVKKWLDNDPDHPDTQAQASYAHSIRSAIKHALKQHQGVVLNADKQADHYSIKILSNSGKIKVIRIEHSLEPSPDSKQGVSQ